jgi:CBS domain-containing protein
MRLSDLLDEAWVAAPMEASDLFEALRTLLVDRVAKSLGLTEARAAKLARDLAFGSKGEVIRVNEGLVIVLGPLESIPGPALAAGVTREPFAVTAEGTEELGVARAVIVVLTPGRIGGARRQVVPAITRALASPERTDRLLAAGTRGDVAGMQSLLDSELQLRTLVEDALVPVKYRVYPDTPLAEVVELMTRRGTRAVPVVGERYEVLGILTMSDALAHLLRGARPDGQSWEGVPPESATARDLMTRTVLCVSEDQALVEAAVMMVNRDVEQLPVVRDGELIGLLTRDSVLRALFPAMAGGTPGSSEGEVSR